MPHDVKIWLDDLGLGRYSDTFSENAIGWAMLPKLDHELLKEMGVAAIGHRLQILEAAAGLDLEQRSSQPEHEQPAAGGQAERRQLTVMFCDLVGSTELSQKLDPEVLREVMTTCQDAWKTVIDRYGGSIARYMGDGVLAYFGYPQAHENDPQRALLAGLRLVDVMKTVNMQLTENLSTPLRVRIGVATGSVVVGDIIGAGASMEAAVVGEAPNLASRLQSAAGEDTVVVSTTTYSLTRGQFQFEQLEEQYLKGFDKPVGSWRVRGEGSGASRFEASAGANLTPFTGRSEERELLERRLRMIRRNEGQVVLISGEAGIDKSRLVETLRAQINEDEVFRTYQCSPLHSNSAFYPVIAEIERGAGITSTETAENNLRNLAAFAIDAGLNEPEDLRILSALLSLQGKEDRFSDIEPDPEKRKSRIYELLIRQLDRQAIDKTTVCLFEDVHWSDPSTVELIGRMVDQVKALPVLLVVTTRPGFTAPWTGLAHTASLTLNRISPHHVGEMVARVAGYKDLPAEVVAQIIDHTDGIPLFVEELTQTVLDAGLLDEREDAFVLNNPLPPLAIPTTLQDSLNARLDHLSDVKYTAQVAAVIGRSFDHRILAAATDVNGEQLQTALAKLEQAGLIHALGTAPEATYTFKHALIRDTAYQSLLSSTRKQLHHRIAVAIERSLPALTLSEPEVLAYHFTEAAVWESAIEYWTRASERSIEASAFDEGIKNLTTALTLLDKISEHGDNLKRELALRLSLGAAQIQGVGPGSDEALRTYARAHEVAQTEATPMQRFDALWGLHFVNMMRGDLKFSRDIGVALIPFAEALNDEGRILESHHAQWSTMLGLGELKEAAEHVDVVLPKYDSEKHHWLTFSYGGHDPGVCAHDIGGLAHWLQGFPSTGRSMVADGVALAERLSHPYTLVETYMCIGFIDIVEGNVGDPFDRAEKIQEFADTGKLPQVCADFIKSLYGAALIVAGDKDEGVKILDRTVPSLDDFGVWGFPVSTTYALALAENGRITEAQTYIDSVLNSEFGSSGNWWLSELHRTRGEILVATSVPDEPEARRCFEQALQIAKAQNNRILELRSSMSLSRLLNAAGHSEKARDLLRSVQEHFTEGLDTPDLCNARDLLDSFS